MKQLSCLLLFFLLPCCNKPERYSVYQDLLDKEERVQVGYVGKNWEIKDAVKDLGDNSEFHTQSFWAYKNDRELVVCVSSRRRTIKIYEQDVDLGAIVYIVPLDQFSKEYKLIKPD